MNFERLAPLAQELFKVALTSQQVQQLETYAAELATWNARRVNLTAITEPGEIEIKHFLDSLSLLGPLHWPLEQRCADVGTGAGFPGLVLKIVRPDLHWTLVESVTKKVEFLQHMVNKLGLEGVSLLDARAEEAGQLPEHRAVYDVVVARAVAYLPTLAEYLLPLCKVGGQCVAMKGDAVEKEIEDAIPALQALGGRIKATHPVALPVVDETRHLIVIEKTAPTPSKYPRRPGMPKKRPLD